MLIVVPPTGTAFPAPWTSHIVNASCEVGRRLGYVIGNTIVWFQLYYQHQRTLRMLRITYMYDLAKSFQAVRSGSVSALPSVHSWQVTYRSAKSLPSEQI